MTYKMELINLEKSYNNVKVLKRSEELHIKIIPLLGITNIKYLDDNINALNVNLKDEDMKYINELSSAYANGNMGH